MKTVSANNFAVRELEWQVLNISQSWMWERFLNIVTGFDDLEACLLSCDSDFTFINIHAMQRKITTI